MDLQLQLSGDENRSMAGAPGPVSVQRRAGVAQMGTAFSTHGPSAMHERSLELGEQGFAAIESALERIFGSDLPALRQDLDAAGVPWTPGRGVPAGD